MSISEILEKILPWHNPKSRSEAKRRLKLVIAHDRAGLNPEAVEAMRREILEVVARYVEIDMEEMEFSLDSKQRMTSLTANLPIRRIKNVDRERQPLDIVADSVTILEEIETVEKPENSETIEVLETIEIIEKPEASAKTENVEKPEDSQEL
jgi:cell division topological specificity factor